MIEVKNTNIKSFIQKVNKSEIYTIKALCESEGSSKNVSRNYGIKNSTKNLSKIKPDIKRNKNSFVNKSKDNFETLKSRFDTEIDKTIDNLIIFTKKKTKEPNIVKFGRKSKDWGIR